MDIFQALLAIVTFVRAGKYKDAFIIVAQLIGYIGQYLSKTEAGHAHAFAAAPSFANTHDVDALCTQIESTVTAAQANPTVTNDPQSIGPMVLPLLIALASGLLKKLLGLA